MSDISQSPRSWILRILFIAMAATLIGRLFVMQVMDDRYEVLANDQAIYRKVIYPARGVILDRKGRSLVGNHSAFDLAVTPAKVSELDTAFLCDILQISEAEFEEKMARLIVRNGRLRQSIF